LFHKMSIIFYFIVAEYSLKINALRSKATNSFISSLLSFLWKRQFQRGEKNEKSEE